MPTIREVSFVWPIVNDIVSRDERAPALSSTRRALLTGLRTALRPVVETVIPTKKAELLAATGGRVRDKTEKAKFESDLAAFKDGDAGINLSRNEETAFEQFLYIALSNGAADFPVIPEPLALVQTSISLPAEGRKE